MSFYRLLKPEWGKKKIISQGVWVDNPDFVEDIPGPNVIEGKLSLSEVTEKNLMGFNSYWFPNHPSTNVYEELNINFLSGKNIDVFQYVFVDMDLKHGEYSSKEDFLKELSTFGLTPTIIIDSGNGIHAYWRVSDLTKQTYCILQHGLINRFKTDPSIWTIMQLMRVPNTYNTKVYGEPKLAKVISLKKNVTYTSAQLLELVVPLITSEQTTKIINHLDRVAGKIPFEFADDVDVGQLPESFIELLYQNNRIYELFTNPTEFYGDRSGADLALANILKGRGLSKKDTFNVLLNTQKALSKGLHRSEYADLTVSKVYESPQPKTSVKFASIAERLQSPEATFALREPVNGPEYFDCLTNPWRKTQILGLIGAPGIGKTTITLNVFKSFIENNPEVDDIFVFFSLEMPEREIIDKWIRLVGRDSDASNRLYVISNEDEKGEPRNIGLQDIVWLCNDLKEYTKKNIAAVAIDYIGIVNNVVDISQQPTFGVEGELGGGWGNTRSISSTTLCKALKPLAKLLDVFLIVLTQTTKGKGQGDTPIDKDGAYGTSAFEWTVDYIISIWQPLLRVQHLTKHRILAWQYAKIRHQSSSDPVRNYERLLLSYNGENELLIPLSEAQKKDFNDLLPIALEEKEKEDKKRVTGYRNTPEFTRLKRLTSQIKTVEE